MIDVHEAMKSGIKAFVEREGHVPDGDDEFVVVFNNCVMSISHDDGKICVRFTDTAPIIINEDVDAYCADNSMVV